MKIGYEYWSDKKIACLGDSITCGAGNDGYGWVEFLQEIFPQADIRKHAVSGSTVAVCSKRKEAPFVERMQEIKQDYDLCMIFGGINDFINSVPLGQRGNGDSQTFCGALEQIITTLLAENPQGQLMLLSPMRVNSFRDYPSWNEKNEDGHVLKDYRDALLELAEYYAVPVLDLYSMSSINAEVLEMRAAILPDGLHPSAEGHKRIARKTAQFLTTQL
ncbi:MAG: SGNH/GDSL hydrolase family protein [Oscillospiraceae bacterium]|nr:SGNH/GDSL hydrolase family protein [Oscillospiraceae bacterium]